MRPPLRAVLAGALLASAVLALAAEPQPGAVPLSERLMEAERAPLEDPKAGRLYPVTAELLTAARDMPESIELALPSIPREPEKPQAAPPAPPPEPAGAAQEPQWVHAVDGPVVDDERLAYTCMLAGQYTEAARLYGSLHEQNPDDVHFLQMLFLSTRNAGDQQAAAALLEELKSKPEAQEWAEWMGAMLKLAAQSEEEQ